VICKGLKDRKDLPNRKSNDFRSVRNGVFFNISVGGDLRIQDFYKLFPHLMSLNLGDCPGAAKKFLHELWVQQYVSDGGSRASSGTTKRTTNNSDPLVQDPPYASPAGTEKQKFSWNSVRHLNLSGNELESNSFPFTLMEVFPNLTELDLARNNIRTLANIPRQSLNQLEYIDLSGKKKEK
jgi:hypothetical protein